MAFGEDITSPVSKSVSTKPIKTAELRLGNGVVTLSSGGIEVYTYDPKHPDGRITGGIAIRNPLSKVPGPLIKILPGK